MRLRDTRALLTSVLNGSISTSEFRRCDRFGWDVPVSVNQVESELLDPRNTWSDGEAFDAKADALAHRFNENFAQFEAGVSDSIRSAAPQVGVMAD